MQKVGALQNKGEIIMNALFAVTHDYEFVCRTCTRILHLKDGTIHDDLPLTEENTSKTEEIFGVR